MNDMKTVFNNKKRGHYKKIQMKIQIQHNKSMEIIKKIAQENNTSNKVQGNENA